VTAIAGLVHEGRVLLGGDSAAGGGWTISTRRDAKVFRTGRYVIGFTTSYRMGQVLRWSFEPPEPPTRPGQLERFMCTTWIDAVRESLKAGGWAMTDSGRESGGQFLVGVMGRLFQADSDYHLGEQAVPYAAVGSGEQLALGAFAATEGLGLAPERRVRLALHAAERHIATVRGPFRLLWEAA